MLVWTREWLMYEYSSSSSEVATAPESLTVLLAARPLIGLPGYHIYSNTVGNTGWVSHTNAGHTIIL